MHVLLAVTAIGFAFAHSAVLVAIGVAAWVLDLLLRYVWMAGEVVGGGSGEGNREAWVLGLLLRHVWMAGAVVGGGSGAGNREARVLDLLLRYVWMAGGAFISRPPPFLPPTFRPFALQPHSDLNR